MKVTIPGRNTEATITRHAITNTELGVAGYYEAEIGGHKIRVAGRWDDEFRQDDTHPAHIAEHVWVDGEYTPTDEDNQPELDEEGTTTEEIARAIAEQIGTR